MKLGIQVSKRTIQRYLPKERKTSTQTWATFLKNHASEIWACDFTVVYDLLFRPIFIFVVLELKTRLIIHSTVTTSPTDEWTAQQLREATPWGSRPKYLIRDHDRKYGFLFSSLAVSSEIQEMKTPFQAPKANAVCERFMGSLKRECLDHTFMLNHRQLERLVKDYVIYYNTFRPHQGIQQRIPERYEKSIPNPNWQDRIKTKPGWTSSRLYADCLSEWTLLNYKNHKYAIWLINDGVLEVLGN